MGSRDGLQRGEEPPLYKGGTSQKQQQITGKGSKLQGISHTWKTLNSCVQACLEIKQLALSLKIKTP